MHSALQNSIENLQLTHANLLDALTQLSETAPPESIETPLDTTVFPIDYDTQKGFRFYIESPDSKPYILVQTSEGWEKVSLGLALTLNYSSILTYVDQCLRLYNKIRLESFKGVVESYGLTIVESSHYFPWNKSNRKEEEMKGVALVCGEVLPKSRLFNDLNLEVTNMGWDFALQYTGSYIDQANHICWQDQWQLRFSNALSQKYHEQATYLAEGSDEEGLRNLLERLADPETFRLELALMLPDEASRWVNNEENYALYTEITQTLGTSFAQQECGEILERCFSEHYAEQSINEIDFNISRWDAGNGLYYFGDLLEYLNNGGEDGNDSQKLEYAPSISYAWIQQESPWAFRIPGYIIIKSPKKWVTRNEKGEQHIIEEGTDEHARISALWNQKLANAFRDKGWRSSTLEKIPFSGRPVDGSIYLTKLSLDHQLQLNKRLKKNRLWTTSNSMPAYQRRSLVTLLDSLEAVKKDKVFSDTSRDGTSTAITKPSTPAPAKQSGRKAKPSLPAKPKKTIDAYSLFMGSAIALALLGLCVVAYTAFLIF